MSGVEPFWDWSPWRFMSGVEPFWDKQRITREDSIMHKPDGKSGSN